MSDEDHLVEGLWLVHGELDVDSLRARVAEERPPLRLVTQDVAPGGTESDWSHLLRHEVAAARADTTSARVLLARVAEDRFLVGVVTAPTLAPDAVLRWLLDPTASFPAGDDGWTGADVPAPPVVDVPAALERGPSSSGSSASVHRLAAAVVSRLRSAGLQETAVLAAGVALLLHRCGGPAANDLVVTGPEPVAIGLRVAERERGGEFVRRAEKAIADGVPVHPLTRAVIAVGRSAPVEPELIGAHRVSPVRVPGGGALHELVVLLDGDRLRIDHDAGRYGQEAVETFADRLVTVLDALLDDVPVRAVTGLTERERTDVDRWSRGATHPVEDTCLHSLVARWSARTPDAPAVLCGDTVLTYRELDAGAERLAGVLRARGVLPGDRVGLLAERAADSVTAMLGVLKAGAAFVPIDPAFPPDRVRHVLLDSGAGVLLAHRRPDPVPPVPVLSLADQTGATGVAADVPTFPDDTAYVVYTSGSTGTPKGIAVHHRAIVASTSARQAGTSPPERDLVLPALCFDGAFGGLFWTLTTGGTAVLPTEAEAHDPGALAALLDRAHVTHVHAVPSQYDLLLRVAAPEALARLRAVSLGGEPLPPRLVARHLLDCPDSALFNDYGPTECAVWATTQRCGLAEVTSGDVPVGGPVAGYRAHVLDPLLRPVPPGVTGEIYLGGPGVALGYHGNPSLTAERFLPDPLEPGARLYRTGDRGRWSPDGRLRITGRVDDQVKVRGFRIELREVAAAVRAHPSVADCAVLLRGDAGTEQLDAFVEPCAEVTEADLRRAVAAVLPGYMRPDRFTLLPALPRTPGGKLDVRALREIGSGRTGR
ncbi:amino acid adenylation domain-containing protein [Umezawaea beigongshangensis]|uniref:amino acid adenylation domain-containing protein n=1 Tax=Umezawaea beigongshangensis TaxID=2780383 RepID=UPI0018F18D51|nr:amino acid adenylation domain-containing protein [Umezawaea beigongshangensis]